MSVIVEFLQITDFNEIKYMKEATVYTRARDEAIEQMKTLKCHGCKYLNVHLGQVEKLTQYE